MDSILYCTFLALGAAMQGKALPHWGQVRGKGLAQGHNETQGEGIEPPTLYSLDNPLFFFHQWEANMVDVFAQGNSSCKKTYTLCIPLLPTTFSTGTYCPLIRLIDTHPLQRTFTCHESRGVSCWELNSTRFTGFYKELSPPLKYELK